jgi:AraC family transcriptional regulator
MVKFEVEIKELPEHHVIGARHIGPYPGIPNAIERLFGWASPKGLVNFPETQLLAVYYDDPETMQASELRSDACITVDNEHNTKEEDHEIHNFTIPGGKFAVAHVEIDQSQYGEAWQKLHSWIAGSDSTLATSPDRLCYEWYLNDPKEHPRKKHIVDICIPIDQ